jgi:hypothetical protein
MERYPGGEWIGYQCFRMIDINFCVHELEMIWFSQPY